MTRKRWGTYLLPLFLVTAVVAGWAFWFTGETRFFAAPLGVCLLWWMLRALTGTQGIHFPTLGSTPGILQLLGFIGAALLSASALQVFDSTVLGHPFGAPLKSYHVLLFSPTLLLMVAGGFYVDRIQKRTKQRECDDSGQ
ncbi:MAG: hypothetical protein AAFU85_23890 [Planctomycetota bacterium]